MEVNLDFISCEHGANVDRSIKETNNYTVNDSIVSDAYRFFCELVYVEDAQICPICGPRCGDVAYMDVCGKCM